MGTVVARGTVALVIVVLLPACSTSHVGGYSVAIEGPDGSSQVAKFLETADFVAEQCDLEKDESWEAPYNEYLGKTDPPVLSMGVQPMGRDMWVVLTDLGMMEERRWWSRNSPEFRSCSAILRESFTNAFEGQPRGVW